MVPGNIAVGGTHDRSGRGQSVRYLDAEWVEPAASALTQARAGCWIRGTSPHGDAELDQAARTHLPNQRPVLWSFRRRFGPGCGAVDVFRERRAADQRAAEHEQLIRSWIDIWARRKSASRSAPAARAGIPRSKPQKLREAHRERDTA